MAFNNPSSGKIDQQRKILEELERQKKLLNKNANPGSAVPTAGNANAQQSGAPLLSAQAPAGAGAATSASASALDPSSPNSPLLSANQRSALEQAAKTSFGYFIAQDSSFGNTILPVIPRIPSAGGK